jgi:chromosome segregation ATPase
MAMWNWNNITGQLKEAISDASPAPAESEEEEEEEDSEEYSHTRAQLKNQNEKASYLNAALGAQQSETERYKRDLVDLNERLRIAEQQNMEVSKEYRRLLIEKEDELNELKSQHNALEVQLQGSKTSASYEGGDMRGNQQIDLDTELEIKTLRSLVEQYKQEKEQLQQQLVSVKSQQPTENHVDTTTEREKEIIAKHQENINALKAYYEEQIQELKSQLGSSEESSVLANNKDELHDSMKFDEQRVAYESTLP